jgi:hypothetical protein
MRTSAAACGLRADISDARLQPALAPVFVALEAESDVNWFGDVELIDAVGEAPADCIELATTGSEAELQSVTSHDFGWCGQLHSARDKDGRRIAHSKRLEVPEQSLQFLVVAVDSDFEIDPHFGDQILRRERRAGDLVESYREVVDAIARDGYSGCCPVTAKAQQKIAAISEGAVKIQRVDRPAGTFSFVAVEGDEHGGPPEFLDNA